MKVEAMWLLNAFLLGCCAGVAPWHWLARKAKRLLEDIETENQRHEAAIRARGDREA